MPYHRRSLQPYSLIPDDHAVFFYTPIHYGQPRTSQPDDPANPTDPA